MVSIEKENVKWGDPDWPHNFVSDLNRRFEFKNQTFVFNFRYEDDEIVVYIKSDSEDEEDIQNLLTDDDNFLFEIKKGIDSYYDDAISEFLNPNDVTYVEYMEAFNYEIQSIAWKAPRLFKLSLRGSDMYLVVLLNPREGDDALKIFKYLLKKSKNSYKEFPYDMYITKYEPTHLLFLVSQNKSRDHTEYEMNGYLLGTADHEKFTENINAYFEARKINAKEKAKYAEVIFINTVEAEKSELYYYLEKKIAYDFTKKNYYFGIMLMKIFEMMMQVLDKKFIILESADYAVGFYRNKLGYVDYYYYTGFHTLEKTIPAYDRNENPEWHKVFSERKQKITDKTANALLLTRGNVTAAAQLLFYRILSRT